MASRESLDRAVTIVEPSPEGVVSRPVVVDTSAWIEALRAEGSPRARALVDQAIEIGLCVVVDPVLAELAVGVRSARDRASLMDLLDVFPCVHVQPATWRAAAELGVRTRAAGLAVPMVDLLIATLVLEDDFELLHADKHFVWLARVVPLRQRWAA